MYIYLRNRYHCCFYVSLFICGLVVRQQLRIPVNCDMFSIIRTYKINLIVKRYVLIYKICQPMFVYLGWLQVLKSSLFIILLERRVFIVQTRSMRLRRGVWSRFGFNPGDDMQKFVCSFPLSICNQITSIEMVDFPHEHVLVTETAPDIYKS